MEDFWSSLSEVANEKFRSGFRCGPIRDSSNKKNNTLQDSKICLLLSYTSLAKYTIATVTIVAVVSGAAWK